MIRRRGTRGTREPQVSVLARNPRSSSTDCGVGMRTCDKDQFPNALNSFCVVNATCSAAPRTKLPVLEMCRSVDRSVQRLAVRAFAYHYRRRREGLNLNADPPFQKGEVRSRPRDLYAKMRRDCQRTPTLQRRLSTAQTILWRSGETKAHSVILVLRRRSRSTNPAASSVQTPASGLGDQIV